MKIYILINYFLTFAIFFLLDNLSCTGCKASSQSTQYLYPILPKGDKVSLAHRPLWSYRQKKCFYEIWRMFSSSRYSIYFPFMFHKGLLALMNSFSKMTYVFFVTYRVSWVDGSCRAWRRVWEV